MDIHAIAARLGDAVSRHRTEEAGRILTDHLGELMLHDVALVETMVSRIDIRMATEYPAIAVAHPHRTQLRKLFSPNSRLPPFTSHGRPLDWIYAMAFARSAGRIGAARTYAQRYLASIDAGGPAEERPVPLGRDWLAWFQLALTSLAAGDLPQATEEFRTASDYAALAPRDDLSGAARLTFAYRALVAALMGATEAASIYISRARSGSETVGSFGWSLLATTRAIVEVEEHTPDSHEAVTDLELIDDQESFWPYTLLARTRYAELNGMAADSLALISQAESRYHPEIGSFAYDVLVARRVEALVVYGRVAAARTFYDDNATDTPHCRLAQLGLICGEQNFVAVERETEAVLALDILSPAQRVQAQALSAIGMYGNDGMIPDHLKPGLGFALSQRRHRRITLMFPPAMREALAPYLLPETFEDWEHSRLTDLLLWPGGDGLKAFDLTPREFALLTHISQDLSTQEIAARDQVSINTVKTQLKSLYKKLGVSSRAEAAASARRWYLLGEEDRRRESPPPSADYRGSLA